MHRLLVLLTLATSLGVAPTLAAAQSAGPRTHLGIGLNADSGGEVDLNRNYRDDDLKATIGLRGHLDYAVHKYVSVGGMLRMSWWKPDDYYDFIDRSFLLDIGPRVVGHYDWRDFRFYAGISPGLTLSVIDDDANDLDNPAAGFTLSLTVAGAEWWFSRRFALFAEIGWVGHWFEHDFDPGPGDLDVELSQCLLVPIGIVFGL